MEACCLPRLDEERDVLDHDGPGRRFVDQLRGPGAHPRMHDGIETLARAVVGEHEAAEGGPVQRAVGRQHPRPEGSHDLGEAF
ncbi:hypothetical protein MN0502_15930 [Arthrobacter sp. MN05-02]|nr:hypothetical protein MN0502_15930 [Arthrobacter sp. MN05-02]